MSRLPANCWTDNKPQICLRQKQWNSRYALCENCQTTGKHGQISATHYPFAFQPPSSEWTFAGVGTYHSLTRVSDNCMHYTEEQRATVKRYLYQTLPWIIHIRKYSALAHNFPSICICFKQIMFKACMEDNWQVSLLKMSMWAPPTAHLIG